MLDYIVKCLCLSWCVTIFYYQYYVYDILVSEFSVGSQAARNSNGGAQAATVKVKYCKIQCAGRVIPADVLSISAHRT